MFGQSACGHLHASVCVHVLQVLVGLSKESSMFLYALGYINKLRNRTICFGTFS